MSIARVSLMIGLALAAAGGACTKPNPAVCCIDSADCAAIDLPESSRCDDGLACIGNQCVERGCEIDDECTSATTPYCVDEVCVPCRVDAVEGSLGCTAAAPVCDQASFECGSCAGDDNACAGYAETPWCGDDGGCAECVVNAHCANPTPVCGDDDTCRVCTVGSECESGVCDVDTGACALPAEVVAVAVTGSGATCTPLQPCADLALATSLLTNARRYLHLYPTVADEGFGEALHFDDAMADSIDVYAELAVIQSGVEPGNAILVGAGKVVTIRGLTVENLGGIQVYGGAHLTLLGGHVEGQGTGLGTGIATSGAETQVTIIRSTIEAFATLIDASADANVTVTSSILRNGYNAVEATSSGSVNLTNCIVDGTERVAIMIDGGAATATFTTFVDVGRTAGVQRVVSADDVAFNLTQFFIGNVVWSPDSDATVPMVGGNDASIIFFSRSLVGPIDGALPLGATATTTPMFVDYAARDLHLAAGSMAIDLNDVCDEDDATVDFDGLPRPVGACDAGAFERQ